jgi:GDP-mannose 6-dehydrogenase
MRIAVIGLGYVGSVCAGCLSRDGFEVVGVDINEIKVRSMQEGHAPVLEQGLEALITEGRRNGRLRASVTLDDEAREADVFLICVGTPSAANGSSNLSHLVHAVRDLSSSLAGIRKFQVVVVRSTVPPGTLKGTIIPLLEERSRRKVGEDLGVAMNPEFLREGSSIRDYDSAPFDLCGTSDPRTAQVLKSLYEGKGRPFRETNLETAEMVKYVNNAFHAVKITFANEVGRLAKAMNIDSLEVMSLLCEDKRLNLSDAYLRPGMAFGGSCLPKDLRALLHEAKGLDVRMPLMGAALESNEIHLKSALESVLALGRPQTAILGLSFKAGTDDLRESPMVILAESLLGKGIPLRIYDRNVQLATLLGANREYIQKEIPHIASLMVDTLSDALTGADLVVVGTDDAEMDQVSHLLRDEQVVIDLFGRLARRGMKVRGICW